MQIIFPPILVGVRFEQCLQRHLEAHAAPSFNNIRNIEFSLKDVVFIDTYCVQILICYVTSLEKLGSHIIITLPESKRVRDQLRVWGVDRALFQSSGKRLFKYVPNDNKSRYFTPSDSQQTYDYRLFPKVPRYLSVSNNEKLQDFDNFFGFRTLHVPDSIYKQAHLANLEKSLWQSHNIKALIEQSMGIDIRQFSARAVFETVFNALRHPSAEIVQTAAHFRGLSRQAYLPMEPWHEIMTSKSNSAIVHYWDDGRSIIDIITEKLQLKEGQRTAPAGIFDRRYLVRYKSIFGSITEKILDCSINVTEKSPDIDKIIYVLQPFVSMSPTKEGHTAPSETIEDDPRLATVGMGLFLVVNTVVATFGGKLRIRTGNMHVEIARAYRKPGTKQPHYTVKINEMSPKLPIFRGNLITMSIPEQK